MAQNTSLHYTVYLDRLFVEYLIIYLLLMLLVGLYLHRQIVWKRLLFGAVVWSIAGLGCLFLPAPFRRWGSVTAECFIGLLLFVFIYGRQKRRAAMGTLLILMLSVMYLTGCFGTAYRLERITGIRGVRILIGVLLTLLLIIWWIRQKGKILYDVHFACQGKEYIVKALLDTGNSLREPITGKAVCIIEQSSISPDILNENEGIYIVPYHAVGTDNGILPAIKVQQVEITDTGNTYTCREMLLAVYNGRFTTHGKYQMLLHQDYIKERNGLC